MQKKTGYLNVGTALMLAIIALVLIPGIAAAEKIVNEKYPIDMYVYNPCNGDVIELQGNMLYTYGVTADSNGGFHVSYHNNPQGLSGVSLYTGLKFQGTGVTRGNIEFHADGSTGYTFVNNFHMVGRGGVSFRVHENVHINIYPDGSSKTYHDNFVVDCN